MTLPEVDTIAALATALGPGAVAVVRVSGTGATEVLARMSRRGAPLPPVRVATLTRLIDPVDGSELDGALVTRFEAPASYTGEDVVEISCHGGRLVPGLVLQAALDAGARLAEPGEFTRRAYLHGKLDLVQAEAVADMVEARSRALHRAALVQLDEGLSRRVGELRMVLVRLEALLAHHVDFPEEDDAPVPLADIAAEAEVLVGRMEAILSTAAEGALLRDGALAVLAGLPNAGKSSLYNALIGEERAIVTDEPGTTRDALETGVQLGGYPFRLVDTAGLRDAGERVERLGVEVARRHLAKADVILLCVEAGRTAGAAEDSFLEVAPAVPVVLVETKADLGEMPTEGTVGFRFAGRVRVSARTGEGLEELRGLLPALVYSGLVVHQGDQPVITRRRQSRALSGARDEVRAFVDALAVGVPAEVASAHLRSAESFLEELVGAVSTEDVLDAVFREFCVGK
ncbi:MAG TPA: tRNA uridine-5-carboxymethylaminomethyl(34) synthesis GTPase MnmE [Longimicrobiales bacterium]|nr:tRNA uridine-5-carboxymethylaminomethyl(34) synthesis GTPase MnmE [Longimicrobiales bacterium]